MTGKFNVGPLSRERRNWQIYLAFIRREYPKCLEMIEDQLKECNGMCEYPIYVKALIMRMEGRVHESLTLFQAATCLNPQNPGNLKQVGRCLYLLGKHKSALDVYDEAQKARETSNIGPGRNMKYLESEDWEVWHNKALSFIALKQYPKALDCLKQANAISRHDSTFMQMGKVYQLQGKPEEALSIYRDALEFSPENPELLTTMGILHLQEGDNQKAFECLGNALVYEPRHSKAILAAGSIIQDNQDMDVALVKYRVAAAQAGYVAAVACLKRALYLDPFEWIVSYNLGLVHLNTGQYASAFHYFSSSINLKSDFAASYMYLAITLGRLDDFDNACSAYEKALELDADYLTHLNYAVTLFNNDEPEKARGQFESFQKLSKELDPDTDHDSQVLSQSRALEKALLTI
ncbi:unnamed protein product [Discosporangium mesarthrocarpum]